MRKPEPNSADRIQPLLGDLGQHLARAHRQVGVGQAVGAPDAPAQLIQLREAEVVGVVDDQRVRVGHVQAGLDDRRAQQHVVLVLVEVEHHVLQRVLAHLAMADRDARLGHELREPGIALVDRLDAVV